MSYSEEDPQVPVIPPGRIGDRFVAVFMTVTLLLFAAAVGLDIFLVIRVSDVANANQKNAVSSCQQSNVSRQEDIAVWNRILGTTPATAAGRAEVADVKRLVKVKDTPHVCN